jgi:hypothetical protein
MGTDEDGFLDTFCSPIYIANAVDPGVEASLSHPLQQPLSCFPILRSKGQSVHPCAHLTKCGQVTQISEQAGMVELHEHSSSTSTGSGS